jgi:carbon monoxide dehydrogenase subunit G
MILNNSFTVDAPIDRVWSFLLDIPKVIPCMPGAQLVETVDERTYIGQVGLKLGPIGVSYKGKVFFEQVDAAAHTMIMKGEGAEQKGGGGAFARITSRMREADGRTEVSIETDLQISGRIAQFGRVGIVQEVARRMIDHFAQCLERQIKAAPDPGPPATTAS